MDKVPVKDAAPYAAADAEVVLQLMPVLREKMRGEGTESVFEELEIPLIPVLAEMEMHGILLDRDFLKNMSSISWKRRKFSSNHYNLLSLKSLRPWPSNILRI